MKRIINIAVVSLILVFMAGFANATLITQNFTGKITFAEDGNPFGVTSGDTFSWTTTYDVKDLDPMVNAIIISTSTDYKLRVTLGNREFIETEDRFYGHGDLGGPMVMFDDDMNVNGISFLVEDISNMYKLNAYQESFKGIELLAPGLDGKTLVSGTFEFNAVPVPAAFWLLGTGLVGLIGLRSRKK